MINDEGGESNNEGQSRVQDILQYGSHRDIMQWRPIGITKFKTFGTGVSAVVYDVIKGENQEQCPTFINAERRSSSSGNRYL